MNNINVFLRIDVNIIAMFMLVFVYLLAFRRLERQDTLNRLFNKVSLLIVFQLFIETLTCVINHSPKLWLIPVSTILHVVLFIMSPILTCYWYFLVRKIVFPNETRYRKRHIIFGLPVVINGVATLLSPVYQFIFYIDSTNVYHRGTYFYFVALCSYFYMVMGLMIIIMNRRKLPKQDFLLLLVFNMIPLIGGITQTLIYGPLLIWSCTAFSLIIAFIFLQQRMVHLDYLTGAWDRGSFDYYIGQKILYQEQKFGFIYVDIDKLKEINDKYGHTEGDQAIKMVVDLIRKEINKKKDIIVRMGGDEFLIILECETLDDIKKTIDRILAAVKKHNLSQQKKYQLEFSIGYDIFDPDKKVSMEEFIDHIDTLMYKYKKAKRERNQESWEK